MNATLVADLFVPGLPQPGGSKNSFVPINKATGQPYRNGFGRVVVNTVESNPKAKDWRASVKSFAFEHAPVELLDGPLAVEVEFRMPRPKGHFGKRGLLASAPAWPMSKPDATKLWRSTEDALTGVLWRDDARIVLQLVRKVFAEDGRTGARVRVYTLERSESGRNSVGIRSEKEALEVGRLFA